jgi:hypothetical protein
MPGNVTTDLWRCPECGARFTTRNQPHSCGRFELDDLFRRSQPQVRELYEAFARAVRACGPVTVIPQKTRIAFQVRMRFAALMPRRSWLMGHLVLAERHPASCFERVDSYSPRAHAHVFRLRSPRDLTAELRRWITAAYDVGRQQHLKRPPPRRR